MRIVNNKYIDIMLLYKLASPLMVIFIYSILFEQYKILLIGSIFLSTSLYYTRNININIFYIFYTACLLCFLYVAVGIYFMLFFIISDLFSLYKISLTQNLYLYFILVFTILIYIKSSIYLVSKVLHWRK